MTKEITDIITAFKSAHQQGRQAALATLVQVEGSSYRMPGARMLVEDNGRITGAISGGCLEGDALRKALQAMSQQQNKLVTYNTTQEDHAELGVQLGCNGIVHILFEPIDPTKPDNPIAILEHLLRQRKDAVIVTLFSINNITAPQPGTCFFLGEGIAQSKIGNRELESCIKKEAGEVLAKGTSTLKQYTAFELSAFVELLQPVVSLVVVGAGNDALPLVTMATILGWQTTIVDGRPTHANSKRFPNVQKIIVAKPAEALMQIPTDDRTVFVLMTHNYNYDLAMLKSLLQLKSRYIGTLGPKKRLECMLAELQEQGITITSEQRSTIYGPIGLDIGAETPEEIALAILSEIKAVIAGHAGASLRLRQTAIHTRPVEEIAQTQNIVQK